MTQDRAEKPAAQQARLWRPGVVLALVILLTVPFLVVGGFNLTTRVMFARMDSSQPQARSAEQRYDAFQHGYASGVMAVLFGDTLANAAGHLVELVERTSCLEREHDLINNREGRALALRIYRVSPGSWRADFADALFADLGDPSTRFSIRAHRDPRVRALCGLD